MIRNYAQNPSVSVRGVLEPGVLSGWIATHTGMPSLRVTVPGPVYAGDRLLINPAQLPVLVSDPLAPPGVPVVYRQGENQVTLTRPDTGFHMVTDRDGRTAVRIALLGDDATDQGTGVSFFEPDTDHEDIPQWGRVPSPSGTLSCRTAGEDTARMLALIRARTPLVSLHSARACQIPDCDIPPARGLIAGSARYARDGVVTQARRVWEIPWTGTALAGRSAPVVTWGEYEAASDGWTDESYEELCRRIAGMP